MWQTWSLSGKESVKAEGSRATKHWPRFATWAPKLWIVMLWTKSKVLTSYDGDNVHKILSVLQTILAMKIKNLILYLPLPHTRPPSRSRENSAEDFNHQAKPVTLVPDDPQYEHAWRQPNSPSLKHLHKAQTNSNILYKRSKLKPSTQIIIKLAMSCTTYL